MEGNLHLDRVDEEVGDSIVLQTNGLSLLVRIERPFSSI